MISDTGADLGHLFLPTQGAVDQRTPEAEKGAAHGMAS